MNAAEPKDDLGQMPLGARCRCGRLVSASPQVLPCPRRTGYVRFAPAAITDHALPRPTKAAGPASAVGATAMRLLLVVHPRPEARIARPYPYWTRLVEPEIHAGLTSGTRAAACASSRCNAVAKFTRAAPRGRLRPCSPRDPVRLAAISAGEARPHR